MEGYYTSLLTDIKVDAMPWKWVRIDPAGTSGVALTQLRIKEPDTLFNLLTQLTSNAAVPLSAIVEED
jgi:hypothetical protein